MIAQAGDVEKLIERDELFLQESNKIMDQAESLIESLKSVISVSNIFHI